MYRDSFESTLAENARLRDEVQQLGADLEALRRMTAPRRALGLLAAGIVLTAFLANLLDFAANRLETRDLDACRFENRSLAGELDDARYNFGWERAQLARMVSNPWRDLEESRSACSQRSRLSQ
jgi:hypothetical protein